MSLGHGFRLRINIIQTHNFILKGFELSTFKFMPYALEMLQPLY
jgi:hypothetical protein